MAKNIMFVCFALLCCFQKATNCNDLLLFYQQQPNQSNLVHARVRKHRLLCTSGSSGGSNGSGGALHTLTNLTQLAAFDAQGPSSHANLAGDLSANKADTVLLASAHWAHSRVQDGHESDPACLAVLLEVVRVIAEALGDDP
jgi:hypothetical protein